MRKIILSALFLAAGTALFAQNFNDVQEKVNKTKFGEAREKLDKMSEDAKATAHSDYWYLRAKIYSNLAKPTGDSALMATALDAIKRYWDMEAGVKDESRRGLKSLFDKHETSFELYQFFFNTGVNKFKEENWAGASYNFANTLEAFSLLSKNKIVSVPFDTTATLYAGYAAQNGGRPDTAVKYYTILAERNVTGENFQGIYEYLASYYYNKKDAANSAKYLALGKSLYPQSKVWTNLELADLEKDKSKKLAKLAELTKQDKTNYDYWLEYGYELFNYTYGKDKPVDYTARQQELNTVLQGMIDADSTKAYGHYIMAQHLNNLIYDMQLDYASIKGTKPEDLKKKTAMQKSIEAQYDHMFKYTTAAVNAYEKMPELKPVDKANYRNMLGLMSDYYRIKKQPAKAKAFDEKRAAVK